MSLILNGDTGVQFNDSSLQAAAASPYGLKNRIINGDMRIDQRNAGASTTPTTTGVQVYNVDRWAAQISITSKFSVQQNAGSVTPPVGFKNYLGVTSLSSYSVLSGDYFLINQAIEGLNVSDLAWGTANAATVTLSFKVYSSLTGTFGGSIGNAAGNRSYPFSYSIPVANTWTTISVTIPGDTSGTWLTTNGIGMYVYFSIGTGTTYSGTAGSWAAANYVSATGAVSVVGTNGATWYLTGVQLEIGSTATPFERRLYNQELAACQRYYQKYGTYSANGIVGFGYATSTTVGSIFIPFATTMRTAPSFNSNTINIGDGVNAQTSITSATIDTLTNTSVGFYSVTVASGLTQFRPYTIRATSTTGYIEWSAEL